MRSNGKNLISSNHWNNAISTRLVPTEQEDGGRVIFSTHDKPLQGENTSQNLFSLLFIVINFYTIDSYRTGETGDVRFSTHDKPLQGKNTRVSLFSLLLTEINIYTTGSYGTGRRGRVIFSTHDKPLQGENTSVNLFS